MLLEQGAKVPPNIQDNKLDKEENDSNCPKSKLNECPTQADKT